MIFAQTVCWVIGALLILAKDGDLLHFTIYGGLYLVWTGLTAVHFQLVLINSRARRAQKIKDGD